MSNKLQVDDGSTGHKGRGLDKARRRLLQGGLGASPLLLTVVSRPALGGGSQYYSKDKCYSPSGFVSMPTSEHGKPQYCKGRTPGYWKVEKHWDDWPHPYYPVKKWDKPATLFKTAFYPYPAGPYQTKTMLQVCDMGGGPPNDVGRHIVAALLNAAKGWTPVLTVDAVKGIWGQYIQYGYYEPTAGVKWYHDTIVDYLVTTMTGE